MTEPAHSRIPATWDDISPEWMTDAVSRHHPGAEICKVVPIDVTKGNNRRARLRLSYASGSGPEFLFAKAEGDFRQVHASNGNLFNEPELFASGVTIPVAHPRPYKVVMDKAALDYVIIMEDITLRGGTPLDCEATLTIEQVYAGVRGLARLHSLYWGFTPTCHPALAWMRDWAPSKGFSGSMTNGVANGVAKAAGHIAVELESNDASTILELMERCMTSFTQGVPTMLHGDPHIGNTFLLPGEELGFLDWQVARRGNWSQDLGYFFVSALSTEDRRTHEEELLRFYRDTLELTAEHKPAAEEIRTRYAASMAFALPIWFATFSGSVTQTFEGSLSMCKRYGQAFVDLDTPGALAKLGV